MSSNTDPISPFSTAAAQAAYKAQKELEAAQENKRRLNEFNIKWSQYEQTAINRPDLLDSPPWIRPVVPKAVAVVQADPNDGWSWVWRETTQDVCPTPQLPPRKPSAGGVVWGPSGPVSANPTPGVFSLGKLMPGTTYFSAGPDDTTENGSVHEVTIGTMTFKVRKVMTPFGGFYEPVAG